mmetsp:Transcript_17572/g.27143  ORF Transcript_17572/g.27143 Transcript_17572/m.27143 type:complete len:83 (-) Transcript_17572:863-1111(-)
MGKLEIVSMAGAFFFVLLPALYVFHKDNFQSKLIDGLLRQHTDQRFMQLVLDTYSEGIVIFDHEKNATYSNPRLKDLCFPLE